MNEAVEAASMVVNVIFIVAGCVGIVFYIIHLTTLSGKQASIERKLRTYKLVDGICCNVWKTEPKGGVPMYKFACNYFAKDRGYCIKVPVRENFDGRYHYGYSTNDPPRIGQDVELLINIKKKEYYVKDDLEAEFKSFGFYYKLYTVLFIAFVICLLVVRAVIKIMFGV